MLIPIFVSVVMPVSIVLIVFLAIMNRDNKQSKIIYKAIEAGNVDTTKLIEKLKNTQKKTPRELLNLRLLRGCIFSLIGIALISFLLLNIALELVTASGDILGFAVLGGISLAIGISYLIVYFVSRNQPTDDTDTQE